ncbi:MAG TPA: hypothetical protein DDX54_01850 [Rhodospirillaceae bacterium]|jgi:predicted transcriptional regulator|nr:hypothetical protein [Alphaproteobacteria bacterium]HBH26130.1 hypothetical protein [Rhodospirillaceae bacterium]
MTANIPNLGSLIEPNHKKRCITVRLAPQTHDALRRAAALEHRTMAALVHRALEAHFDTVQVWGSAGTRASLTKAVAMCWEPNPLSHLLKLVISFPCLATNTERALWRAIMDDERCWRRVRPKGPEPGAKASWDTGSDNLNLTAVCEHYYARIVGL